MKLIQSVALTFTAAAFVSIAAVGANADEIRNQSVTKDLESVQGGQVVQAVPMTAEEMDAVKGKAFSSWDFGLYSTQDRRHGGVSGFFTSSNGANQTWTW